MKLINKNNALKQGNAKRIAEPSACYNSSLRLGVVKGQAVVREKRTERWKFDVRFPVFLLPLIVVFLLSMTACSNDTVTAPRHDYTEPISEKPEMGDGSEETPYQIANLANLYWISQNESLWNRHFVQTADIDASYTKNWFEGKGWTVIGYYESQEVNKPFTGFFDGNDYVISGLFINRPDSDYQGLFGRTEGAVISNAGIINVDITGRNRVGALVGNTRAGSLITNSYSTGSVLGYWCVGGLVGGNWTATLSNSYSSVNVTAGSDNVGGLVGYNGDAQIINCYSTGFVVGVSGNIGGMIGMNVNSEVVNSYWNKDTSGQTTSSAGEKRTTEEMVYPYFENTYRDWDFGSVWVEDNTGFNEGYPYLKWQR